MPFFSKLLSVHNTLMGNEESSFVTHYSFFCTETNKYLGQEWNRRITCELGKSPLPRYWTLEHVKEIAPNALRLLVCGGDADSSHNYLTITENHHNLAWSSIAEDPQGTIWLLDQTDISLPETHPVAPRAYGVRICSHPYGLYAKHISGGVHATPNKAEATIFYMVEEKMKIQQFERTRSVLGGIQGSLRKVISENNTHDYPKAAVTPSDIEFYKQNGFFLGRSVIPPDLVRRAREKIQEGLDAKVDRKVILGKEYQRWTKNYKQAPELMDLFRQTPVFKTCEALAGIAIRMPKECQIALRQPRSDGKKDFAIDVDWHVDAYGPLTACWFSCIVLIALSDWDEPNMGNFTTYPGSPQKISQMLETMWGLEFRSAMKKGYDLGIEPQQVCAKAGDVIFAHPLLAHDIAPNLSDQTRWAVLFRPPSVNFFSDRKKLMGSGDGEQLPTVELQKVPARANSVQ